MKINRENGFALPLVMIAILVGALVLPVFLSHVSAGLIGSRDYHAILDAQYACDSGAEHAVWNLTGGNIKTSIPVPGDNVTYNLPEPINGLTSNVKISNAWEVIASDNFESGNWAGGSGWLNNWSASGDALVTATGSPYDGTYHLRLSSSTGVATRSVELSQQVSAHLRFWARVESFDPADTAICRISHDGTTWTTIYTWAQSDADNIYHYYDIDLTPYGLTDNLRISFLADMSGTGNYLYIDDLDVVWPAISFNAVAADDFESGDWSGGSGWLGDWTPTGSASVNTAGAPYGGNYHLLLQSSGNARREIDLSSYPVVHLQFWAKADNFEPGDQAFCLVSSDGNAWQTVYTWNYSDADNVYRYYDIDISNYGLTANFWIAFQSGMDTPDSCFYVDDVSISAIDAYCITVNAGGRTLKAAVDLMNGQKKILCWWFI